MAAAAIAADLHQPLDVHRDLLAEVALDAALLLDHPADLPDVVLRQILHADVRADAGILEDVVRTDAPDAVDVGEPDLDALGARKIDACDTCHIVRYPSPCSCRLSCAFWFGRQITRTTPRRRTILHLSQIRLTDARTFIDPDPSRLRTDRPMCDRNRASLTLQIVITYRPRPALLHDPDELDATRSPTGRRDRSGVP